jgi:hypothetical protein
MKEKIALFKILKYLFNNRINGYLPLPKKLFSFAIIDFLKEEEYINEEYPKIENEKNQIFERRFLLTQKGTRYFFDHANIIDGRKIIRRSNYIKNSLLTFILVGISIVDVTNLHLFGEEKKSEHNHNEVIIELPLNHFKKEYTTDSMTIAFKKEDSTTLYLKVYK